MLALGRISSIKRIFQSNCYYPVPISHAHLNQAEMKALHAAHLKLERRRDGLKNSLGASQVVDVDVAVRSSDDGQRVVDVHRIDPLRQLQRVGRGGTPTVPAGHV